MATLWAVVGATGTGKSEASLDLAERLAAATGEQPEIVNADAMQLYRGMDIGTAKLPEGERRGIRHHLFDAFEPHEEATVARYQPEARARIAEILASGADAILVGGSGLYVSSVVFDFQFPPRDEAVRAGLEADLESSGVASLVERLRALAPDVADAVDKRNPRRVVRALEVALLGGDARVTLPSEPEHWSAGDAHDATRILGVACAREVLTERLDRRVEGMWAGGMLSEVRGLLPKGLEQGKTASRAIGYAQALAQLRGELSESDAIAETQALTRRYARRQVSWFKRYPAVHWIDQTAGRDTAALDALVDEAPR
ncbi:tRNA (adenosine(37)-N6)-dimethylallyltransferase MiaA [Leucobacter komagatae]|uniref:tRNA dimethylallyltransferase n=1 Tax=Leucobacter komagatae TaxID=55969 RepID=A0A0D0H914_9MICO|nr:tRNA (adenosine(37)-N6)-dimethylallyltransferase MiaA [Leucobacter komagatae]KIP53700.1 tRNA delta(2)-isopentenylpyrophosphate transferase [Leucobacter komagatae]